MQHLLFNERYGSVCRNVIYVAAVPLGAAVAYWFILEQQRGGGPALQFPPVVGVVFSVVGLLQGALFGFIAVAFARHSQRDVDQVPWPFKPFVAQAKQSEKTGQQIEGWFSRKLPWMKVRMASPPDAGLETIIRFIGLVGLLSGLGVVGMSLWHGVSLFFGLAACGISGGILIGAELAARRVTITDRTAE